jgi:hypothetical protein
LFTPITSRAAVLIVVAGIGAATLTGCGSSSSGATTTPQTGASHGPSAGFGMDSTQQRKVQKCLKAAGLASALPTGRPSGAPNGSPGARPSGFPSGRPSGFPSGGPGGGFADPQVRSALQACGITLPSRPAGAPSQPAG